MRIAGIQYACVESKQDNIFGPKSFLLLKDKRFRRQRKQRRVRNRVRGSVERPRLAVFKSLRYIYAQLIDDQTGHTLAQANSREAGVGEGGAANIGAAKSVGETLALRAIDLGIKQVVFEGTDEQTCGIGNS